MKILIINAEKPTPLGHKRFLEFRFLIQKAFLQQKEMIDTEMEYIIRDAVSIVEFLYEVQSSYVNQNSLKAFHNFDMVFVAACSTLLPWDPYLERVLVLLRMCLKTKKYSFVYGSAFQALVFLSASNFERTVYMLNPKGEAKLNKQTKSKSNA